MWADRLSSGIMPWDEWYHAMALAKVDRKRGATCVVCARNESELGFLGKSEWVVQSRNGPNATSAIAIGGHADAALMSLLKV